MNEGIYYLRVNDQVEGPYTIGQIYDLWAARKINSQTLFARFEEMDRWQPLSELTLRISAPKTSSPKQPDGEQSASQAPKPKPTPNFRVEDYYKTLPKPPEPRVPARDSGSTSPLKSLSRIVFSFEAAIGLALTAGLVAISYFLFLYSASNNAQPIFENFLATKQGGVLAGVALIFLGGFLVVARELRKLQRSMRSKPEQKPTGN